MRKKEWDSGQESDWVNKQEEKRREEKKINWNWYYSSEWKVKKIKEVQMNMAGQTINDRLLAARHSLAGQGLAKSVCKATTEEMIAPKKKHLDCKYQLQIFS